MDESSIAVQSGSRQRTPARRTVLVCTPFPPRLDARHGGKATAQLLARLAARNDIVLLYLRADGEEPVDDVFVERCQHVEEVRLQRPVWSRYAWSRRLGWAIGFLRGIPAWAADCRSEAYEIRLRSLAAEWRPDVVEFHLQVMAQYVSALEDCPAPRILVDYDPPSAWAAELMREVRGPRRLARRFELGAWRRYERTTRRRFDAIVVFAKRDIVPAASTAHGVPVHRIPLSFDLPERPLDPVGSSPPTLLFFGGFGHPPNVDAARWLADSIFPRVLERTPAARLELVGDNPGEDVRRLEGRGVAVHGSVPDVTPYLSNAAVVVAPIRLGGSMRGKVLETLGAGKALVATPRAAEGLDALPGVHFVLAADEDELVDALVGLLGDADQRRELAGRAREWAERNLNWDRSLEAFEQLYDSLSRT